MELKIYNGNDISCNSYLLIKNNKAIIIDPIIKSEKLVSFLKENNICLLAILLTHGHYDHIRGVETLKKHFDCPIYIHYEEQEIIVDEYHNGSVYFNDFYALKEEFSYFDEQLEIGDIEFRVIHTPFHTQGSVVIYVKELNALFSGDTLFKRSIGRFDLYSGNKRQINDSLNKLILLYKELGNMKVYPGHGASTSLEEEIKFNPYFSLK